MTVNEIIVLLAIYVGHSSFFTDPSWWVAARVKLEDKGMIERMGADSFEATPKGVCYVDNLTGLPLPISTWRMPKSE